MSIPYTKFYVFYKYKSIAQPRLNLLKINKTPRGRLSLLSVKRHRPPREGGILEAEATLIFNSGEYKIGHAVAPILTLRHPAVAQGGRKGQGYGGPPQKRPFGTFSEIYVLNGHRRSYSFFDPVPVIRGKLIRQYRYRWRDGWGQFALKLYMGRILLTISAVGPIAPTISSRLL